MKKSISVLVMAAVMAGSTTFMPMHTAEAGQLEDTVVKGIGAIFRGIFDKPNTESSKQGNIPNLSESGKQKHAVKNPNANDKLFKLAVKNGDIEIAKQMLETGVDVNGVFPNSHYGETALGIAVDNNNRNMQQFLLENGADIKGFYNYDGEFVSYFVVAADRYDLELMKYLHAWGAPINSISGGKSTGSSYNALTKIVDHFRSWDSTDAKGAPIIEWLIEEGIDTEMRLPSLNRNKCTAYLYSIDNRCYRSIKVLADGGADLNAKDEYGKNSLDIAIGTGDLDLVKFIKEINARGQQPSKKKQ